MRISIFAVSLLLTTVFFFHNSYAGEISGKAPNFTLKSKSGKNLKLSEQRGNVVMINFWASWCGPCRQEMPLLDAMYKKYKRLGFTIWGVNIEPDSSNAQRLLKDIPVSFPILFDTANKVSKMYNVSAMPSTVLVDRNGNLRYIHKGYKPGDESEYRRLAKKLLRE
ncbi:MAG: TlpA disulfide reductase family protein [Gammaproteobacteria bacterium]